MRILPFSCKGVERAEIMLANLNLTPIFLAKNLIFIIKHSEPKAFQNVTDPEH
jgi:hypothetical protein